MGTQTAAAELIRTARRRAGLSQAELARRAEMPRSVVNAYERGHRQPSAEALQRLARAAGADIAVTRPAVVDADRAARLLEQVLDLAQALPFRRSRAMRCPRFVERVRVRVR